MNEIREIGRGKKIALLWLHEFEKKHFCTSRRESEKKGTVFLLNELFPGHDAKLEYLGNGRPYVKNIQGGISITHSHDLLAVLHDEYNEHTGIDVELVRDKVLKIRHKFLSEKEKSFIPEKNVPMHIMAWCIKESIYKIHAEGKLDFAGNIFIDAFSESDSEIKASYTSGQEKISKVLKIERMGDYILSYPLN